MNTPHIPILRFGKVYESLDKTELLCNRTQRPVAEMSMANAGLIRRDARRFDEARAALDALPCETLVEISEAAGEIFLNDTVTLPDGTTQTYQQYVEALSATTGLPWALCRANASKVHYVLTNIRDIIRGLTRGLDLSVLDEGIGTQADVAVSYFANTNALGVVLPSNSPGVHSIWAPAIALKTPLVLKPGREEPWTPLRVIQSFIAAGAPPQAFCFYPTDHEGSSTVMDACKRAIIFGGDATVSKYRDNPAVEVHGAGRSKVLIGDDQIDQWENYIDVLADSIARNSGRSCINASTIMVPKYADEIADALARKLVTIEPKAFDDPDATLAGFANPAMAEWIDTTIDEGLREAGATDVTAKHRSGGRRVQRDGSHYLLPTVVRCETMEHPLANTEFLFPYTSVVQIPQSRMLAEMGHSLVVTAITKDRAFADTLLNSPLIDRLNLGPMPTCVVKWDQPHEGNLFDFLYRRRAIQYDDAWGAPVGANA